MEKTRRAGKAAKATLYFTGKPCKHGHISVRFTSTGQCRECTRKASREHPKKAFWNRRHRGIPEPEYPAPECCECCENKASRLCIDHDHETGKFRGWLCVCCNSGIGKLGDTLQGLMNAVEYLKRIQE